MNIVYDGSAFRVSVNLFDQHAVLLVTHLSVSGENFSQSCLAFRFSLKFFITDLQTIY